MAYLTVSYKLTDVGNVQATDEIICRALEAESCGSGAGFGKRDLEFQDIDLAEREIKRRLKAAGIQAEIYLNRWGSDDAGSTGHPEIAIEFYTQPWEPLTETREDAIERMTADARLEVSKYLRISKPPRASASGARVEKGEEGGGEGK